MTDVFKTRKTTILTLVIALTLVTAMASQAAAPNLMAAFFVKGKVGLKWAPIAGVTEYQVYRKAPGEDFVQVGTSAEDRWFDENVTAGVTYVYKVAIDDGGTPAFSGEKSVTIPGDTGAFNAPTWAGVRLDQDKVYLKWDTVQGSMAYNVWRGEVSGGPYEVIGTSQGNRYVDKAGLVKGTTYYYVISAMNAEFDETPQSEERSIKYGISLEEQQAMIAEENKIDLVPYPITAKFELTEGYEGGALNQPADVAINSKKDIYVVDTLNARVHCYTLDGQYKFSFGGKIQGDKSQRPDGQFFLPFTIEIDSQDQIFVGDIERNDIQVFRADGTFLRRIRVDTDHDLNPLRPNGLAVLDDGRLVMTDAGNHRFLVTDAQGKILVAKGDRGGEDGQFIFPDQLTVSPDNEVFIVDPINGRIQVFSLDGQFLRKFGSMGFSAGQFGRPKGIAYDGKSLVWVSDGMSNMLQGFTLQGEVKSALGGSESDNHFNSPRGMVFSDGQLIVVQRLANKVAVYGVGP